MTYRAVRKGVSSLKHAFRNSVTVLVFLWLLRETCSVLPRPWECERELWERWGEASHFRAAA